MKKEEYYLRLSRALEFVEANLNNKIALSDISQFAFSSLSHFHRIFYFMTGITLKDYIRQRRLSNAGVQLLTSKKSIIDIAYEAQFESPESFNKSFKKMFQLSPRAFRNTKPEFTIMRKMEIIQHDYIKQPENISLQFVYLLTQNVVGFNTRTTFENSQHTTDIPHFFEKIMQNNSLSTIPNVIDHKKTFGVYTDMSDEEEFNYTIGYLVDNSANLNNNFSCHQLPRGEYAKFTIRGDLSVLESAWRYIYGLWMPTSGRTRQEGFDFEIYGTDHSEIYIPMTPQLFHDTK